MSTCATCGRTLRPGIDAEHSVVGGVECEDCCYAALGGHIDKHPIGLRRLDSSGRDVTELSGLWDEPDHLDMEVDVEKGCIGSFCPLAGVTSTMTVCAVPRLGMTGFRASLCVDRDAPAPDWCPLREQAGVFVRRKA